MRRSDSHEPLQMMPWWVSRWLSSKAKAVMTLEQQAAYFNLLNHAWLDEDCSLRADDEELRRLAGASPEEWARCGATVMLWFAERGDRYVSIPQKKEWQLSRARRIVARRKARKAGLRSGSVRRSRANSKLNTSSRQVELEVNPPSPSPSQSPSPTNGKQRTDMSASADLAVIPPVDQVFTHWQSVTGHSDAKFTPRRKQAIAGRLREGYSVGTLMAAVNGCRASPFHQGENDRRRVFDDITLICRDGEHVEQFVGYLRAPPKQKSLADDPDVQAFLRGAKGGEA